MSSELTRETKALCLKWKKLGHFFKPSDCAFYLASTYRLNLRTDHINDSQRKNNVKLKAASLVAGDQLLDEEAGFRRGNT